MLGDPRSEPALQLLASDPATRGLMHPHYVLGLLATRRGQLDRAAQELEQALTLVPYFTDALVALAEVYLRRGQTASARAQLLEAQRFDPQNSAVGERLRRLGLR
jgi:Flp pilus assembly protein TadD